MAKRKNIFECSSLTVNNLYRVYYKRLYNIVASLFTYENMPDTINEQYLNSILINEGRICWTKFNDSLYCCRGNYGGQPDEYYIPEQFTIANPVLGSKVVNIKENTENQDGVFMYLSSVDLIPFETETGGLYDLLSTTAQLLADNVMSISIAQINTRVMAVYTATSTARKESAESVLKSLYDGDLWKIVATDILSDFRVNPLSGNNTSISSMTTLIEMQQYILANFYHCIGFNSNYNMKRERLNTAEIDTNFDGLKVNVKDIKQNLTDGFSRVNKFFGTDIIVKFPDEWNREGLGERKIFQTIDSEIDSNNSDNNSVHNTVDSERDIE